MKKLTLVLPKFQTLLNLKGLVNISSKYWSKVDNVSLHPHEHNIFNPTVYT